MSNFSIGLEYAWQTAATEASRSHYEFIEPDHLFVGVCKLGNLSSLDNWNDAPAGLKPEAELVAAVLQKAGYDRIALYRDLRKRLGDGGFIDKTRKKISRSPSSRLVFERAAKLAAASSPTTSLHLLSALLESPGARISAALAETAQGAEALKNLIRACIATEPKNAESASFLQHFGKDLTQLARDGRISPCIGRRDELLQIIRALSRETKSNPLLLGDAGVGKTAIVEGLAWRIAQNKDAALAGKRLVQLNVADLVAGASSRGEF